MHRVGLVLLVAWILGAASAPADPDRAKLQVPADIWDVVRGHLDAEGEKIGYDAEAMGDYGRSTFLLPTVLGLFRDARTVPRFSGRISEQLLADAEKVADRGYGWSEGGLGETARRCYRLLGTSTARRVSPETLDVRSDPFPAGDAWRELPIEVRELVTRLYLAAERARPWLMAAYDQDLLRRLTGEDAPRTADLHAIAMAHRNDEHVGQLATPRAETFRLFESVDLAYLGYATVLFLRDVEFALQAFEVPPAQDVESVHLNTPLGDVVVGGPGNDRYTGTAFLTVELGGNDRYGPGWGSPTSLASPITFHLDVAGHDEYGDTTSIGGFGAGIFGLSVLCDLAGDDVYVAEESALGYGCFGSGFLIDFAGNDAYSGGGRWTQGAAHAGIGVLLDLAGDDRYSCATQSQGLGATMGCGLLLDRAGDDEYTARDDGNISELYLGQSVAMSQGCGYGRRADLGDGHSMAGGFGLLIDGAGDDDYHAQVWSQGCGYWWGVGILEDRGGDDQYRNGKYSSGAAAHFAIGVHVDLEGNDRHNLENDTAKNQYQGHARDGSIGIFIDGAGDDAYAFRSHCAGSGDLGSIGFFWDRRGNDRYIYDPAQLGEGSWAATPPLGSTTQYDPFHSFRDERPVYGIFLDTGGEDAYETGGIGRNDHEWTMRRNPNAWGVGMDLTKW